MPFNPGRLPDYLDDQAGEGQHDLFVDHCVNIIERLRNTRLVDSFNDNLEALSLRLDNIKLRFVIWARSTHKIKPKSEKSVFETLTRLNLFLLHESETIRHEGSYGMIDNSESRDQHFIQDASNYSKLETSFRTYVERYLEKHKITYEIQSKYNAWIVTEPVQCLNFLMILDSMVEDLFSFTADDLSVALASGYIAPVVRTMTQEELLAIQKSSFSGGNLISRAAANQLSRIKLSSVQDVDGQSFRATNQVQPAFASSSKDTKPALSLNETVPRKTETLPDVAKRFAEILKRCRETQETVLQREYPISQLAQRRVMAELRHADMSSPFTGLACLNNDISNLLGIIRGPPNTPYEDGIFFIKLDIPKDYPLKAAGFRFLTKIYHPNIDSLGRVCVKISDELWAVTCTLEGLLTSLVSLLASPNEKDPLMPVIAQQYVQDRRLFEQTVRIWVADHACKDWPTESQCSPTAANTISDDWVILDDSGEDNDFL